ncbi:hypothetical protein [Salinibaculum rarum]|uniref:hypothetical protein n=1 Tax=Salinibaculum rarum TaxID=3058903 RepID=UPI00265EF6DB|nr:hypothetical protein [Salinibaculum sp. KK48]
MGYKTHGPHTVDDVITATERLGFENLHRGQSRVVFRVPDAYTLRPVVVKFPLAHSTEVWTDGIVQNHNEARRLEFTPHPDVMESYLAPVFDYHPAYAWLIQLEGETYSRDSDDSECGMRAASRIQQGLLDHGLPGYQLDTSRENIASFGEENLIIDYGWWEMYDNTRSYMQLQRDAHSAFTTLAHSIGNTVADTQRFPEEITLPESKPQYRGDAA